MDSFGLDIYWFIPHFNCHSGILFTCYADWIKNLSALFFRRLQSIEKERAPQVLAIRYSDEEEGEDDEEGGFGGVRSEESSDEESEEERHDDSFDTASPDSSFLSLSPGEHSLAEQTWENL